MGIRVSIFLGLFIVLGGLQWMIPGEPFKKGRIRVMVSNGLVVLVNNAVLLLMPLIPLTTAQLARSKGYGFMPLFQLPMWLDIVLCLLILDLIIYWQHRLFHQFSPLWRLHRMHHMEPLLDVTSGFRFHPLEIVISNFIKVAAILMVGVSPVAVLIFEVWLSSLAMFNHANIDLPKPLESLLTYVVFTPLKHNVHHSLKLAELSSNYGFSVPWWDMIFGTYKTEGSRTIAEIKIGMPGGVSKKDLEFPGMLWTPFKA